MTTAGTPTVQRLDDSGPQIRILYCFSCKSIEEIPDYEGRPEDDVFLQLSTERHASSGIPHTGHLFKVAVKLWSVESIRKQIIKQIHVGSGGLSELDPEYYNSKSTFSEDALRCYATHLRPRESCPDYGNEKKRLVPNTNADRKELGMPTVAETGGPKVYLCQFCPIHSVIVSKKRALRGTL